jgi:hypothetical protein
MRPGLRTSGGDSVVELPPLVTSTHVRHDPLAIADSDGTLPASWLHSVALTPLTRRNV